MSKHKSILITGATSGVGWALAKHYANKDVNLVLCGRNSKRLEEISKICEAKGAIIYKKIIDVRDEKEMSQWISSIDNEVKLDLVIANAGISAGTGSNIDEESPEQIKEIFDINLYGVLNTINPIIPLMKNRKNGQIVLISSLASFKGFPSAPAYCASKAAIRIYGEALRAQLKPHNIKVNVICPGFIISGITQKNKFKMPFLMEADKAAIKISNLVQKDKGRIAFPFVPYLIAWILSVLPESLSTFIAMRMPSK